MKYLSTIIFCIIIVASQAVSQKSGTRVSIQTSMGEIQLELYDDKSPETVKNFLAYVDSGFYKGTIFHRVIPDFMIQGGGFTADMTQKQTRGPIVNEAKNGLSNERGTMAMARTGNPNSATAQFFINMKNNTFLDNSPRDFGYCVFGKVIKGMEVVDSIGRAPRHNEAMYQDVPDKPVVITSINRI